MADPIYEIQQNPPYDTQIRTLQDNDPARATTVFNPLMIQLINNTHHVKRKTDTLDTRVEEIAQAAGDAGEYVQLLSEQYQTLETEKANKVLGATDNFAAFDANGNLKNSGKNAQYYETALSNKFNFTNHHAKSIDALSPLGEGIHRSIAWTNLPQWFLDKQSYVIAFDWEVKENIVAFGRRLCITPHGGAIAENICNYFVWSGWHKFATDELPQKYALPLTSGWVRINAADYWKAQDGQVTITFRVGLAGGAPITAGLYPIATLPVGFRPSDYTPHTTIYAMGTGGSSSLCWVANDGILWASVASNVSSNDVTDLYSWASVAGTITFLAT